MLTNACQPPIQKKIQSLKGFNTTYLCEGPPEPDKECGPSVSTVAFPKKCWGILYNWQGLCPLPVLHQKPSKGVKPFLYTHIKVVSQIT